MADESWWGRTKEAAIAAWDRLVFEAHFPTADTREARELLMDVRKGTGAWTMPPTDGPTPARTWSQEYEQNTGMSQGPVRPPMKLEASEYVEERRTMDASYRPPSVTPRIADGRQHEIGLGL